MIHTREKALVAACGQQLPRALQAGTGRASLSAALSFWSLAELSYCWVSQSAYHLLQAGTHAPAVRNTARFQHNGVSHSPKHAFSWSFKEVGVFSFAVQVFRRYKANLNIQDLNRISEPGSCLTLQTKGQGK